MPGGRLARFARLFAGSCKVAITKKKRQITTKTIIKQGSNILYQEIVQCQKIKVEYGQKRLGKLSVNIHLICSSLKVFVLESTWQLCFH